MERARKIGVVVLIAICLGIFGYTQYASASHVMLSMAESELVAETDEGSNYNVKIRVDNPSLLILPGGEIEFHVIAEDVMAGKGRLGSFTLQPLSSSYVDGTFQTYPEADEPTDVTIYGVAKYDMLVTSFDIPFVYQPTDEQAREFIHPS